MSLVRGIAVTLPVCVALAVVGCDANSPTDPSLPRRLSVPDRVSFTAPTGSTVSASAREHRLSESDGGKSTVSASNQNRNTR